MTGRNGRADYLGGEAVGTSATVPATSDTIPAPRRDPHRIGCLLGCRGFGHDPECPLGEPMVAGTVCSANYKCKTVGVAVLADPHYMTCPCVEAQTAHAGGVA